MGGLRIALWGGAWGSVLIPTSQHSATQLDLPRRFGSRHVLLKALGEGGMGQIFLALSGGRLCALKTMRPDRKDPALIVRFREEAHLMTQLAHRNVVYATESGDVAGDPYFAMEYVRGRSLQQVMARCSQLKRRLPVGLALFVTKEVLLGLGHLHEAPGLDFVHRDISATNVMLGYDGAVKIIDLGLGKWRDQTAETMAGQWGQGEYKSPEHLRGQPLDARSDIFSVGVMLWEMLTAHRLFPDPGARAPNTVPPPPSRYRKNLPEDLEGIVMTALAVDPSDRYRDVGVFLKALRPHLLANDDSASLSAFLCEAFAAEIALETEEERRLRVAAESMPPMVSPPVAKVMAAPSTVRVQDPSVKRALWVGLTLMVAVGIIVMISLNRPRTELKASSVAAKPQMPPPAPATPPTQPAVPSAPPAEPATPPLETTPQVAHSKPVARRRPVASPVPEEPPEAQAPQATPESSAPTPAVLAKSESAQKLLMAGERLLGGGDFDAAITAANDSLKVQESAEAYILLARVYWARRLLLSAERATVKGLTAFPGDERLEQLRADITKRRASGAPGSL